MAQIRQGVDRMEKFRLSVMAGPHSSADGAAVCRRTDGRHYTKSDPSLKGIEVLKMWMSADAVTPIRCLALNLLIS